MAAPLALPLPLTRTLASTYTRAVSDPTKPISFSDHAVMRLAARGSSETEVIEAIRTASWSPAELGRLECRKTFPFRGSWNKKSYSLKEVRPIFVEEPKQILVVTVYVYFR